MRRNNWIRNVILLLGCLTLSWAGVAQARRARVKPPVQDFTKGDKPGESHAWNLGATGARGWMYGWAGQTAEARQILVTAVAKGSPADGVLEVGDVILGVEGKPFNKDARKQFARAVMTAETKKAGGKLSLIRWRNGKKSNVQLKLAVMGSYSDTAPYNCEKSRRIFDLGCKAIAKKGLDRVSIPNSLNALALLASGRDEYKPMLAAYARKVADYHATGYASWHYGCSTLFLAEYAVATKDSAIMPGLRRLVKEIAAGQSAVGTWGHKFARPNGNCNGYGCMNLPGLILVTAMVVSREAGIAEPAVDRAIAKSANFMRWYVNKGAIPYGDHLPWPGHEDNGKCSNAAVLFDLLGDREATAYFGKMSTAAYDERERGHTGNFFNMLWAMLGVSRCGPLATGTYMKEHDWYYDLARGWDGSFGYQGSPIGEEEHRKYTRWDCTGAYMLTYAPALKSLCIAGKKPCSAAPLNQQEVAKVIDAGRDYFSGRSGYQNRTTEQLLAGLSSWSPAVRKRSALALGKQKGDFVPTLLKMLAGKDVNARYGACEALGYLGPRADAAAPQLRTLLNDSDPWLQSLACAALPALSAEQRKASLNDLLKLAVRRNPADPRRMAQRGATQAIFAPYPGSRGPRSILATSLDGVDRKLLYPAIRAILQNDDGAARGTLSQTYGKLSRQDLAALLPAIIQAIDQLAPSNEMFGDGIRLAGLDLVSKLHIREGMPLCVSVIESDRWGSGKRAPRCIEYLARYGKAARVLLPQLRKMRQDKKNRPETIDKIIETIEAATASPKVVSMKEFIALRPRW